jgi:Arc/MetJ-type ribon-helix-helix transcriptional regulator
MVPKKKRDKVPVSAIIPRNTKKDILIHIKGGDYKSVSDFLRHAIYNLLDEKTDEKKDILKKKSLKNFIEEIS